MQKVDLFGLKVEFDYLIIGIIAAMAIILIINIVILCKLAKNKKRLNAFMSGKDAQSLEAEITKRFRDIEELKKGKAEHDLELTNIKQLQKLAYSKVAINKYDAFNEMGGKLSFALAMLDNNYNGFIINAMHSREGCYTYIKEIVAGEPTILLGDEEKKVLDEAKKQ